MNVTGKRTHVPSTAKTRALTHNRDLVKTVTFAVMHFTVAFLVTWALTGDILIGSLVAMVEPAINTVAFYFHEKSGADLSTPGATTQTLRHCAPECRQVLQCRPLFTAKRLIRHRPLEPTGRLRQWCD